jgi:hypothetical protein
MIIDVNDDNIGKECEDDKGRQETKILLKVYLQSGPIFNVINLLSTKFM